MKRRIQNAWLLLVPAILLLCLGKSLFADENAYVGSKICKKCHLKEWKSWAETKMANSFDLLAPGARADAKVGAGLDSEKDYRADPECVRCHTTGFGKAGGFVDAESTPELVGVGCEMCHGAGGTYTQQEYMSIQNKEYKKADVVAVGLVGEITVEQCKNCHNTDSPFVGDDYVFDFEARKTQGTHEHFPLKYQH